MIAEATIDCSNESECVTGFYTMLDKHLVAVCTRGRSTQCIGMLDLPLLTSPPDGTEWIVAHRHWAATE